MLLKIFCEWNFKILLGTMWYETDLNLESPDLGHGLWSLVYADNVSGSHFPTCNTKGLGSGTVATLKCNNSVFLNPTIHLSK
jgi:hypothetical protein